MPRGLNHFLQGAVSRTCCEHLCPCTCSYVSVNNCGRGGYGLEGVVKNLNED